jgi:Leucine-rich repeat (LRR) protein
MKFKYKTNDPTSVQLFAQSLIVPGHHLNRIKIKTTWWFPGEFTIKLWFSKEPVETVEIQKYQLITINNDKFIEGITHLDCHNECLTELKDIPSTIKWLDCSNNKLTDLNNLPETLEYLDCSHNPITKLPVLPNLTYLNCSSTILTELPELPKLEKIYFSGTNITHLRGLSKSIKLIDGFVDELEGLPLDLDVDILNLYLPNNKTVQYYVLRLQEYNRQRKCLGMEKVDELPDGHHFVSEYQEFKRQYNIWLYSPGGTKYLEAEEKINELKNN